jgi:hypothetical protein
MKQAGDLHIFSWKIALLQQDENLFDSYPETPSFPFNTHQVLSVRRKHETSSHSVTIDPFGEMMAVAFSDSDCTLELLVLNTSISVATIPCAQVQPFKCCMNTNA